MDWLPYITETIVLPYNSGEVRHMLKKVVKPFKPEANESSIETSEVLFNGNVFEDGFRISKQVQQPENALPLMVGKIESTSNGSLVFIKYRLFFSTLFFLSFWSIVTFLMALFFIIGYHKYMYAVITLGLGVSNYVVTLTNFKKQVVKSQKLLNSIFT